MAVMAIQLNTPVIFGIGIGGAVFVIFVVSAFIIYILRRKHNALLTDISRDSDQRRRAHFSITDEDVRRMPGMQRIRPSPYSGSSGWAPVSSRESVAKKSLAPNPTDVDPVTGVPPWPVRIPRRLKKAPSSPAVRVPLAVLSPITEGSTNNTATSPSLSKVTEPETDMKTQPSQGTVKGDDPPLNCPRLDVSSNKLKPKPLFHGQQRSFSHGVLTSKIARETDLQGSSPVSRDTAEFTKTQLARMRRSSSLCSQQPGQAPTIPIPPLPFELEGRKKPQPVQSPPKTSPRRISGNSLMSGNTSVLDEIASKSFSQADTDFTSISLSSPPVSVSTYFGLGISNENHPKWNFSRADRAASPLGAAKVGNIRPQVKQQHSFRASIHNSLPRSASSGLSMSLLDHNTPDRKVATSAAKSRLEIPGKADRNLSRQDKLPQASPLSKTNIFKISEDMRSKRASTSILQVVSGNQASPVKNPWVDRPTSIATDDPFRWDPKTSTQSGKPSAMKNGARRQGHKRQSCVRISNIPIIIPSRNPSIISKEDLQPTITPLASPLPSLLSHGQNPTKASNPKHTTGPQVPSRPTFDPQLPKGIRSSYSTTTTTNDDPHLTSPYSPTFSMIPLYSSPSPPSSPSSSLASTPTRPPQTRNHPNRRRAIFPSTSHSGPLLSSSITPSDPPTTLEPPSPHPSPDASRPPSFLLSFPSPPHLRPAFASSHNLAQPPVLHRGTSPTKPTRSKRTSPVRGPRPLPSPSRHHHHNRVLKPSSYSPSLSPTHYSPRNSLTNRRPPSPLKLDMLRRSIMELRRMNSEIAHEAEKGGHRRYLSLGEEEDDGDSITGGGEGRVKVKGPREMGKREEEGLYDGEGFLREVGGVRV
ncbi:MAG: hypothetical protein LQ338_003830 [Usnochroma carphineum]|nr:MAG: hypothetical protein LQ338_003830 [Usnochroma carphineum]